MSSKTVCPHCGKNYDSEFTYCPYCAEPKPKERTEVTPTQMVKSETSKSFVLGLGAAVIGYIPCVIFVEVFALFLSLSESMSGKAYTLLAELEMKTVFLIALVIDLIIASVVFLYNFLKSPRQKIIDYQFNQNQTSICPQCGSHDVSLGRKGYDWKRAFWGDFFGFRGERYLAGIDSRRVTAYCNHCGHKWLTNREWIR